MMVKLRRELDIETLMNWREEVIYNVFGVRADQELIDANKKYYANHVAQGAHIAIIASVDNVDCGCGAICFSDELPSPDNPAGKCAYLMNIYVREQYRNHGVANKIIERLVNEAKSLGCGKIYLESTDMAKPLYLECGFTDMENMMEYED